MKVSLRSALIAAAFAGVFALGCPRPTPTPPPPDSATETPTAVTSTETPVPPQPCEFPCGATAEDLNARGWRMVVGAHGVAYLGPDGECKICDAACKPSDCPLETRRKVGL